MSLTYDRIIHARSAQIEHYEKVACRSCGGPMVTCTVCLDAGSFPLQCAGPCAHVHTDGPVRTPMPAEPPPPPPRKPDFAPRGLQQRLKRAAKRCVVCGWDNPRGAVIYRWSRCQYHYERTARVTLRMLQRVLGEPHA